ncbi:MAG: hypothetical protein ACE5LU_19350 [Anaerolineae bacterium]
MKTFGQSNAFQQAQQAAKHMQQAQQRMQQQAQQAHQRQMAGGWWMMQQRRKELELQRQLQQNNLSSIQPGQSDQRIHPVSLQPHHRRDLRYPVATNPLPDRSYARVDDLEEAGGCARVVGWAIKLLILAVVLCGVLMLVA